MLFCGFCFWCFLRGGNSTLPKTTHNGRNNYQQIIKDMKFTKEEALKEIKAMLGEKPQISERSILEATETLLTFAGEETELPDFMEKAKPFFKTFEGNLRAEVAEKVKSAKVKEPEKDPASPPVVTPPEQTPPAADEPAWFKAFREKSEADVLALQEKLKNAELQKTVDELKTTSINKAKGIYPDSVVDAAKLNFDFSKEGAEEAFINSCTEISKLFGVKPAKGGSENPQKIDNSDFKAQLKQDGLIPS